MASKKKEDAAPAGAATGQSTVEVTLQTLEGTPARVVVFLRALGTSVTLRSILAQRGYTADEHRRGWHLLHKVSGYESDPVAAPAPVEDKTAARAVAETDAWDDDNLPIIDATLRHRYPDQHAFVLRDLRAGKGAASLVVVKTLLDRVDILESGKGRPAAQKTADQAALATLAARVLDEKERARLRALLDQAERYGAVADLGAQQQSEEAAADKRLADLRELRAWYEEWSTIARAIIKRRDHLLRLGLAQPKRKTPTPAGG